MFKDLVYLPRIDLQRGDAELEYSVPDRHGTEATQSGIATRKWLKSAGLGNHEWLTSHGVIPVAYGDGVADRIRAAAPRGVDAFIDTHGDGYVELALALGVAAKRIDTIADYADAQRHGVKTDGGQRPGRAPRCSPSWPA